MNDDQSFYEIQLNTPHLVLAFLGAAVVGVALFWLGVIIGRGQSATAAPSEWQAATPVEESGNDTGDDPAEFFDDSSASSPTVPVDDSADSAATSEEQAGPEQPAAPVEETDPDPPPSRQAFQAADPVEEEPAPVAAGGQSGLPAPDPSLVTGWVIQVRSTPQEAEANALQQTLAGSGFPAFVISAEVDGTTYYRVRVGRYGSRADADVVEAALIERADIEDAWVTEG